MGGLQSHKKMPFSQVLVFTTTNLAQGLMLTMPFTVAVYMVRAFLGGGGDEAAIGRLTGLLAAVYSFSQFTTSYAWGVVSTRIGRKPVMLLGCAASALTLLWFGLAGSFAVAAAARVVAGLLNGIIVAWKCSIGESCDTLEQGRILSYMSLAWGIGCILGPSIGGIASSPCNTWPGLPGCGPGRLLQIRPYFLPCAISAAVNAAALCLNLFVLRETLPQLVAAKQQAQHTAGAAAAAAGAAAGAAGHGGSSSAVSRMRQGSATMQAALAAAGQGAAARVRRLFGRRASAPYHRLDSRVCHTAALISSSSSSTAICGAACTGCPVCWQLWRAESGLQQQQQLLRPLQPVDSAVSLELVAAGVAADKQQGRGPPQRCDSAAALWGQSSASFLRQQSSVSVLQQQGSALLPGGSAGSLSAQQGLHGVGSSSGSGPLQPHDSASEITLQQYKAGFSKPKQLGSTAEDASQQQQEDQGAFFHAASRHLAGDSDCTILVATAAAPQQQQQQHRDQSLQQQQEAACDDGSSDPLLTRQQGTVDSTTNTTSSSTSSNSSSDSTPQQLLPWYKQRQVVLVLLGYGTVALLFCAIDELTPIFASAPLQQGGLRLSEVQLAGPLSFNGVCLILVSLLAFPAAQKAWGTLPVTRYGLVMAVLVALTIPCTRFVVAQHGSSSSSSTGGSSGAGGGVGGGGGEIGALSWAFLYLAMLLKALAGCFAFTGTMILVNTSVRDPQQLGAVNGVGQSLASLARGIGPAMGGLLWGMAVHLQGIIAGAQMLPFACVAGTAVVALLLFAFVHSGCR